MISRFQPARLLTPILIILLIAVFSYWLNPAPWHHLTTIEEAEFGGGILIIAVLILVFRNKMYLKMDASGLEVQLAVGAPRVHAWSDIEGVKIVKLTFLRIPLSASIHLRLRRELRSDNAVRKLASGVTGSDTSFPAFFDLSAEEIVTQIEYFRRESANTPQAMSGR